MSCDFLIIAYKQGASSASIDIEEVNVAIEELQVTPSEEMIIANQLKAITDVQFGALNPAEQLELVHSIGTNKKNPGEIIIREGDDDDGGCFYLVLGPPDAQVEVVRMVNGAEEFLTRLGAGEYFGQKYFMNNRTVTWCSLYFGRHFTPRML